MQKAVIVADVHYNISTLTLADAGMHQAINMANSLKVPLIVAGDLHDTKAQLRGECVKAIISTFKQVKTKAYVLVGNHCLLNEKGTEHSLEFLRPYANIVDRSTTCANVGILLPYFSDTSKLLTELSNIKPESTIIMHQGVQTAYMGHYIQDKTSLPKETFKDFRVISGHYHKKQDIKCGRPRKGAVGLFSYIGNLYTLTFGEANDGPKGFQILNSDGLLTFVPTNLRKHVILETHINELNAVNTAAIQSNDLVWVKLHGPLSELKKLNKNDLGKRLFNNVNYKLDLIPDKSEVSQPILAANTSEEVFDKIIDALSDNDNHKNELKDTWRDLLK